MKKFLITTVLIFLVAVNAEAAKIDAYREILLGNSYTIRYENLTPAPRVTNKDRVELYGKSGLAVEENEYLVNRPKTGVITASGGDRYEEVGSDDLYMCRLSKDGEDFFFTKYQKRGKWEYVGERKNRVVANDKNYLAEILEGKSFGDADMTHLLNAILPNDMKSAAQYSYRFIAAGKIASGLDYEDFRADSGGVTEVVRYYFDAGKLVKIAAASYHRKADGKIDGRKCIIKISEFSATPESSLLKLPAELKDVTRR